MTPEENSATASQDTATDVETVTGAHPGGPQHQQPPFPAVANAVRTVVAGDASGHGMAHAWRMFRLTQQFVATLDADRTIVGCVALVHRDFEADTPRLDLGEEADGHLK
ncbi:MAG: hypothetical protein J07HX5_00253 [halophilic archaeon J07HX5]|nr:MAG: hypothetical protein J07HX5_00253 [halophilic archaeon J07HX5]